MSCLPDVLACLSLFFPPRESGPKAQSRIGLGLLLRVFGRRPGVAILNTSSSPGTADSKPPTD